MALSRIKGVQMDPRVACESISVKLWKAYVECGNSFPRHLCDTLVELKILGDFDKHMFVDVFLGVFCNLAPQGVDVDEALPKLRALRRTMRARRRALVSYRRKHGIIKEEPDAQLSDGVFHERTVSIRSVDGLTPRTDVVISDVTEYVTEANDLPIAQDSGPGRLFSKHELLSCHDLCADNITSSSSFPSDVSVDDVWRASRKCLVW